MPLRECIQRHTYREYLVTLEWLNQQPDDQYRTESYLKLVALRVQQVLAKDPKSITLKDQELKFNRVEEKPTALSQEEQEAAREKSLNYQKSFWKALTGFGNKLIRPRPKK